MTATTHQDIPGGTLAERPEVEIIDTANLGDRSYVVHLDGEAVVIDPQRDLDRMQQVLDRLGLTVTHVLETHVHNDYVSGGYQLAQLTGAQYVLPVGYDLQFDATQIGDGDTFTSGAMEWRAVHTPGHTPQHLSYAVSVGGVDAAVFTGGSMLFGSVGRPDLIGPDHTKGLAHSQWRSVRRLTQEIAEGAGVFPTHGFGSFCSATATVGRQSTVGEQRSANPAALLDEEEFVSELLAGLDAYPAYYAHMAPANQAGPAPIDLTLPELADPAELRRRIEAGEWVVDLRSRRLFAAGHLRGSLSFDGEGNAVTYLAWLIPWGTPLTLLAAAPEDITRMQRELVRVGIDRPAAHNAGSPQSWAGEHGEVSHYPRVAFGDVAQQRAANPDLLLLDARRVSEWNDGHVQGARHLPLHDLPGRVAEIAAWSHTASHAGNDATVWVYCGSGFRAAVAASLLERAGVPVAHVDDDFPNAATAGLPITTPEHVERLGQAYTD